MTGSIHRGTASEPQDRSSSAVHSIEVPPEIVRKWQEFVNLLAEIMHVPSASIMRVDPPHIKVFVSSTSEGNPCEPGALDTGPYCETVMRTGQPLLVPDALENEAWKANPHVKLGMISYLGVPIAWPDGGLFGTICVRDNKRNEYSEAYLTLLLHFRDVLQADLKSFVTLHSQLEQHEAKIRRLVDANIIGIIIWDLEGRILEANDAFLSMGGYDRDDLISGRLNRTDLTPPEWRERDARTDAELKMIGAVQPFEKEYFRKDGGRVPVLIGLAAFSQERDQGVAFVLDLTERKRAENTLREREAQLAEARRELRQMIDTIPIPVASYSADARRDFVNAAWKQYTGLSDEAALGTEWSAVSHPDDVAIGEKMWRDALATGEPWHTEERVRRADGQYRWFAIDRVAARDENGKIIKWYGTAYDIEDRKRAEERLRVQHTVAQILAEAVTIEEATPRILRAMGDCLGWDVGVLWRVDREAEALRCVELWHKASIAVPEFERVSREFTFGPGLGLPGRVWSSLEPEYIPDVAPDENFPRAPIAEQEGLRAAFGFPILLGREVLGVIEFFSREIRQPDQELLNVLATIGSLIGQFIERKRSEQALRRSEAYLAEAQRLSHCGVTAYKGSTVFYGSEEIYRIWGFDPAQGVPSRKAVLQRIHPDDFDRLNAEVERALGEKRRYSIAYRIVLPDGTVKHLESIGQPVFSTNGELVEVVATQIDVTERKRAEQALRDSEAKFRDYAESASDWFWETDPDHKFTHHTQDERHLARGFATVSRIGVARWEFATDVQSEPEKWELHRSMLEARQPFRDFVYRATHSDGSVVYSKISGKPVFDANGEFRGYRGTGTDVTALVRAQEQQTAISEVLRAIAYSPHDLQPIFDAILDSAKRLCRADMGSLRLFEESGLRLVGVRGDPFLVNQVWSSFPVLDKESFLGRLATSRLPAHIPDLTALKDDHRDDPWVTAAKDRYRTALFVPLLKDNAIVGIISLGRTRVEPFTDKQISLFRDFAAQATIALESTRLERRYREAQMALAHANRVATMGQLTASITHEVNQPITAAVTYALAARRFLSADPPNFREVDDALSLIVKEGNRAGEVVGRVRALIKKVPPRKDAVAIDDAILEVIALTRTEAANNSVSVRTQATGNRPVRVFRHAIRMCNSRD
jgi:PAS domain S-box-containing protein